MTRKTWERMALLVVAALVVALFAATGARADPILTVTNGDFHQYSGVTPGTNNDYFQNVNPTGWVGGGGLIFITNYTGINNPNLYLHVWGPTQDVTASPTNPFPNSPIGGNFVEADGNPYYENSFSYTQLSGLTVGQEYQLTFFQAAGQQSGFYGSTTNQWIVGLGTPGSYFYETSIGSQDYYHYSDPTGSVTATPLMTVPHEGVFPWEAVTVYLTADAPNDVLTFLAWGDNGSTVNLPPIAFLDIANNGNPVSTPEPASLSLMVIGMFGIGAYRLRRRRSNPATI